MSTFLHYREFGESKALCGRRLDNGTGTASNPADATCPKCLKKVPKPVYEIDHARLELSIPSVGITVQGLNPPYGTIAIDVSRLTRDSFLTWLRSQDTHPDRDSGYEHRERIILKVLGYEPTGMQG